jgi:hypothetical protein
MSLKIQQLEHLHNIPENLFKYYFNKCMKHHFRVPRIILILRNDVEYEEELLFTFSALLLLFPPNHR